MSQQEFSDITKLSNVNQKLGDFPIIALKSGEQIPTGTVATLLFNIRAYDAIKARESLSEVDNAELKKLEGQMETAIPILKKLGFFDLFSVEEWRAVGKDGISLGRRFVGEAAARDLPKLVTS